MAAHHVNQPTIEVKHRDPKKHGDGTFIIAENEFNEDMYMLASEAEPEPKAKPAAPVKPAGK